MNWVKKAADKIRKNRSSASFEKLCENISHIDAKFYATNRFTTYGIVPAYKRLTGKSCTFSLLPCSFFTQNLLLI